MASVTEILELSTVPPLLKQTKLPAAACMLKTDMADQAKYERWIPHPPA